MSNIINEIKDQLQSLNAIKDQFELLEIVVENQQKEIRKLRLWLEIYNDADKKI